MQLEELKIGQIQDFWQWAFSDLRSNNVRGIFAEWLVAQILGLSPSARTTWDSFDLTLPNGKTLEIKSAAYLQSWHKENYKPSKIRFTGLKGLLWNESKFRHEIGEPTYNADFYVFCVQNEKDIKKWNAFDLEQWDFYILDRIFIEKIGSSSITLSTLKRFSPKMNAQELAKNF